MDDDSGWLIIHANGYAAYGSWRGMETSYWSPTDQPRDPAQARAFKQEIKKFERRMAAENARRQAAGIASAEKILAVSVRLGRGHPYLDRKGVKPAAGTLLELTASKLKQTAGYSPQARKGLLEGRTLVARICRIADGSLSSLEFIDEQGRKSALRGGVMKGCAWLPQPLPDGDGDGLIFVVGEGISTVLSIIDATGWIGLAARSCGNLAPVVQAVLARYPNAKILICGDRGNGEKFARDAARMFGVPVAIPEFPVDCVLESGDKPSDFNDLVSILGVEEARRQLLAASNNSPDSFLLSASAPRAWAEVVIDKLYTRDGQRALRFHDGAWRYWNGSQYIVLEEGSVRAQVYELLDRAMVSRGQDVEPFRPTRRKIDDCLDALKALCFLEASTPIPSWLDQESHAPPEDIFACRNGLLDLQTRELRPHTPDFFNSTVASYEYDPKAPKPKKWLLFLKDQWGGDNETIETLQELFGLYLTKDTSHQKIGLLIGPKRSGKGTIGRALVELLGQSSVCSPTLASLSSNFGMEPLVGKQLAIFPDARIGRLSDQAAISERLLSLSGEDALTIDRKYRSAWTGRLSIRCLIFSNELPRIGDASGAFASRFIILTMTKSFFGKEDHNLEKNLAAERAGILNWALGGLERLRQRGYLRQPKSSSQAVAELEELTSPIGAFLNDCCLVGPSKEISCPELFQAWIRWCVEQRREHSGTLQSFGRDLRANLSTLDIRQPAGAAGEKRIRYYIGLCLRPPSSNSKIFRPAAKRK